MMPARFLVFFERQTRRFQRSDWPRLGTEEHAYFCLGWIEAFADLAVTPEEAEAASELQGRIARPPMLTRAELRAAHFRSETRRSAGTGFQDGTEEAGVGIWELGERNWELGVGS